MAKGTFHQIGFAFRTAVAVIAGLITLWAFGWVAARPFLGEKLEPGQVQLRLVHWGDDREAAIVVRLIEGFEKKYPHIRVERIHPGGAEAVTTKIQTMVAAGDPPDVFQLGYEKIAGWADYGLLAELEPFLESDAQSEDPDALGLDDFYTNVIDCFRFDGTTIGNGPLYAIAKDFTTVGFYYNKDLFKKAGVPEPPLDGWTWEEFITTARKIGQLEGCFGADCVTWEPMLRLFCWTHGVDFTYDRFETFDFTEERLQQTLDRLRGWFEEDTHALRSAKTQLETGEDPFLSGRIGMAGPFGRWKIPVYRLIEDFEWDFAPLPHAEGHAPVNGIFTSAWALSAKTRHSDEAWLLIRYLCDEEGQRLVSEQGLAIPSMIRVAQSKAFTNPAIKPVNDRVYLDMIPYARAIDWPADPKYLDKLRKRMEEIYKIGQRATTPVLADVQAEWEEFRRSDVLRGEYPLMPWGRVALGFILPVAGLLVIGVFVWWRRRPSRVAFREELAGMGMVSPWVLGFLAFTAFPVVLSLLLAFTNWSGLATLDHAEWVAAGNVKQIYHDAGFAKSLAVTAFYALLAVPLGQLAALLAAMLMNHEIPGIRFFRAAWYLPSVLAGVAIAILWKWVFHHEDGMLNDLLNPVLELVGLEAPRWFEKDAETWAVPAFVIMNFWMVGGSMMIYLAGLKGISKELYEAAAIDGATWRHRVWHVMLPMLSPVIFFNTIMAIIASFQVFTQAYVMTAGGPGDATRFYVLYLYNKAFDLHDMGYASALAWLLLLIILVLTLSVMWGSKRFVYYEALKT
ncbi:MAG: extracellular solute-binding protein [Phycisphaerae bacterium]|nr:extracellular solute-binding protein [Phycisphaerae bacterium]